MIDFENYLQVIKKLIRKGSYVLTQIMNRINEKSQLGTNVKHHSVFEGRPVLKQNIVQQLLEGYLIGLLNFLILF